MGHNEQREHYYGFEDKRIRHMSSYHRELRVLSIGKNSLRAELNDKIYQILFDIVTTMTFLNCVNGPSSELNDVATTI